MHELLSTNQYGLLFEKSLIFVEIYISSDTVVGKEEEAAIRLQCPVRHSAGSSYEGNETRLYYQTP
jgi:hypothetical protein